MKKISAFVVVVMVALSGLFVTKSEAQLSNNNRRAVVLETFYALRPSYDGGCDKTIGGNCVSSWNYLNNDYSAYNIVKSWYGCSFASLWKVSGDGCGSGWPASFFNNVAAYGYGTFGGWYGSVGRGGQCKYFANLILYRSGSHPYQLPTYATMWDYGNGVERNFALAVPGDILTSNPAFAPHTAIVVEIKPNGLDVIDANFVSDAGSNREVIGRHLMLFTDLDGDAFGIWKGISYYNEPYIP